MSATIELSKIQEILAEYESDLIEEHLKEILSVYDAEITIITAAKVRAVREIRDRLKVPEIKE